jgi:tRNA dimethylallyltransferase
MLAAGLVDEVTHLRSKYQLSADLPAMRCVGYRQVWEMLEGTLPATELADRGIFATRQFAKRQLTWLRALRESGAVDIAFDLAESATTAKILHKIDNHLTAAPQAQPESQA